MPDQRTRHSLLLDPNLGIVFAITLMAMLGVANITPAFPQVAAVFQVSPQAIGLIISAFTVPGVVLTPVLGILADRYGRKVILVPSLVLFGLAGAACGLARDFELLLGLRLLQGIGAAALGALNVTLIGDLYEGNRRTTAMGYNSAVLSIGTGLYPVIGGALASIGWYVPFFLTILAVPVAVGVLFTLHRPQPRAERDLRVYLCNAAQMLRRRDLLLMFAASTVIFVLIYGGYLSYLPFVLQRSFDASALLIGVVFSTASASTACAAFLLGRLAAVVGERRLVAAGFALQFVGLTAIPLAPSIPWVVASVAILGVANGITIPSILSIIAAATPDAYRGAVMSVNGMLFRLGQTLGPLVAGVAYVVGGLGMTFWIGSVLAAGTAVVLVASRGREVVSGP